MKIIIPSRIIRLSSYLLMGYVVGSILFLVFLSYASYEDYQEQLKKDLIVWKKTTSDYPYYPDHWMKLSTIWYNLKEKRLAKLAIKKARKLDPLREEFKRIEKIIN